MLYEIEKQPICDTCFHTPMRSRIYYIINQERQQLNELDATPTGWLRPSVDGNKIASNVCTKMSFFKQVISVGEQSKQNYNSRESEGGRISESVFQFLITHL